METPQENRRHRALVEALPQALLLLSAASALYGVADVLRPGPSSYEIPYYAVASSIPLLALVLHRSRRARPLPLLLVTDAAWTGWAGIGLLFSPTTTLSGTAYILSLKWLSSALLLPWPVTAQRFSVAIGLTFYFGCLLVLDRSDPLFVHQWLLPPIAAALSTFGARLLRDGRLRRQSQAELLEQSEQGLQDLLDQSPDGMFVGQAGKIVFANNRLSQILESAEHSLVGTPAHALAGPDHRGLWTKFLRAAEHRSTAGDPISLELAGPHGPLPITASAASLVFRSQPCVQVTIRDASSEQRNLILLEAERRILEQIASGTPLAEQLEAICKTIERLEPDLRTSILLKPPEAQHLTIGAAPSLPQSFLETIDEFEIREGNGTCGTAAARRERVTTSDVQTDPCWADYQDLARTHDIRACWSVPVLTREGEVMATFANYRRSPGEPSAEALRLVEHAIHLTRVALQRHRMEADRNQQAELFATLADVGRALISSLEEPVLLERLCSRVRAAFSADVSHVYLADPTDDTFVAMAGDGDTPEQWDQLKVIRIPRSLIAELLEKADKEESVEISQKCNADLLPLGFQQAFGIHAGLFVALRRGRHLIGAITAGHRTPAPIFTAHHHRMARGIAQMAALALNNSRLMRELEDANQVKSNFVASMSHELRTPLNVLIGYQDLLLEGEMGPLNDEQRDIVGRLLDYSRQLLTLVNDTLDLSRLEAGRMDMHRQAIDVAELIDRMREEARDAWGQRNVEIRFSAEPGLVLDTDETKLLIVLRCLIGNAVKFADNGTVDVRAQRTAGGIEFRVADTGIGIAAEDQQAIFEPFTQGGPGIGARFGGAGLGLHIAARFLALLGGTISVESELGSGSTFRVVLPDTGATIAGRPSVALDAEPSLGTRPSDNPNA